MPSLFFALPRSVSNHNFVQTASHETLQALTKKIISSTHFVSVYGAFLREEFEENLQEIRRDFKNAALLLTRKLSALKQLGQRLAVNANAREPVFRAAIAYVKNLQIIRAAPDSEALTGPIEAFDEKIWTALIAQFQSSIENFIDKENSKPSPPNKNRCNSYG